MPFKHIKQQYLFLMALAAISSVSLYNYVLTDLISFVLGMAAVLATSIRKPTYTNYRFAVLALSVCALTLLVPVKTLLFFVSIFIFFYWVEAYYARMSFLSVAALIICSPIFQYTINAFSFPIRLQLTNWVAGIFKFWQTDITAKGNVIFHKGNEFAIDPACMGLHMLSISVLSGLLLVGLLQKKYGKYLPWKISLLYVICLFLLNVIANLVRIVLLVQFTIMPATIMHEATGLICLLLYVCIPAAWLARKLVLNWGNCLDFKEIKKPKPNRFLPLMLLTALVFTSVLVKYSDTYSQFTGIGQQQISGYKSTVYLPGILKLENSKALVYVKFVRGFYDTEHNPSICWKGGGYEFRNIQTQKLGKHEVITAVLTKDKDVLYTAWWFGNGINNTTDQLEWRWDMMKGAKNYAVINLTATTEQTLHKEVIRLLEEKTLLPLFNKDEDGQHKSNNQ